LAGIDFARARVLGLLGAIEKSGHAPAALAWRPGPGRAHIAWQAMHLAATTDRYMNVRLKGGTETDADLVARYGGGSTPSDEGIPSLEQIRSTLELHYNAFRQYVAGLSGAEFDRVLDFPNNVKRSLGESIVLLTWHEGHHQGQIHLTWNLYKAAHGLT
ncbi:MAG TPA: DinB family protein, partial [Tepidisphaeraceae bacterium]